MREELRQREGVRGEFTAAFCRYGWRRGYHNVKTALFIDVRDSRGRPVTDHLWFTVGTQVAELDLKPYERVRFVARVEAYRKGPRDNEFRALDYRLKNYSNMQREGTAAEQRQISLFGTQSEAIICSHGRRAPKCRFCDRTSAKLCDFLLIGSKAGKTCDAPLCDRCATSVGPDRDLCPPHARQGTLGI